MHGEAFEMQHKDRGAAANAQGLSGGLLAATPLALMTVIPSELLHFCERFKAVLHAHVIHQSFGSVGWYSQPAGPASVLVREKCICTGHMHDSQLRNACGAEMHVCIAISWPDASMLGQ